MARWISARLQGTGTVSGSLTGSGAFNIGVNGSIGTYNGLVNAIVRPWGRAGFGGFSPYFGGGLGFSNWDSHINGISPNGSSATVNSNGDETDLAADCILGFDYAINSQMSIGAAIGWCG